MENFIGVNWVASMNSINGKCMINKPFPMLMAKWKSILLFGMTIIHMHVTM
jgi:hypothetical protein